MYQIGAGWIFGGRVPAPVRVRIDRDILSMRATGKVGKVFESVAGGVANFQCRRDASSIGPAVLGLPLALIVAPLFLPLAVQIIIGLCRSHARRRD